LSAAPDDPSGRPRGDHAIPWGGGLIPLLLDVFAPVAVYYALRAGGVDQVAALLACGVPPAVRVAVVLVRTRRVDTIGALVLAGVALGVATTLMGGDARTLLIRNALLGAAFALWTLASLRARRPLVYRIATNLLPAREHVFERAWAADRAFRGVWRRLTVVWGCGLLVQTAANVAMAATLPVDAVPGLDSASWLAMFVVLLLVTVIALHRSGVLRTVLASPDPA
jgi:intracellular septation protein A